MRQRRIAQAQVRAHARRGDRSEPDGLARYRRHVHDGERPLDRFPHGRYCLDISAACDGEGRDMRVKDLYCALMPFLDHGLVEHRQAWIDLVRFVDELMDREDDWYACDVPWPLADVRVVVEELAGLLADQPSPYPIGDPENVHHGHLTEVFTDLARHLAAHAKCCTAAVLNVHWW